MLVYNGNWVFRYGAFRETFLHGSSTNLIQTYIHILRRSELIFHLNQWFWTFKCYGLHGKYLRFCIVQQNSGFQRNMDCRISRAVLGSIASHILFCAAMAMLVNETQGMHTPASHMCKRCHSSHVCKSISVLMRVMSWVKWPQKGCCICINFSLPFCNPVIIAQPFLHIDSVSF